MVRPNLNIINRFQKKIDMDHPNLSISFAYLSLVIVGG